MKIVAYNKCSLLDYHPYIAAVAFTPGCNMCCAYCHNRSLLHCRDYIDENVIFTHLKRSKMVEAIVISGGEPTLQGQELIFFLQKLRNLFSGCLSEDASFAELPVKPLKIKLDTNGSNPELLAKILALRLVDYVAMDIKATPESYQRICGLSFDRVKDSIALLREFGAYEFRTTAYPKITLGELEQLCMTYQKDPYFLQQYRRIQEDGIPPYDNETLQAIAETYKIKARGI